MEMGNFDKDFVERTKWIVENISCQYEITLLLNCMLALVSLPIEKTETGGNSSEFRRKCVEKLSELGVIEEGTSHKRIFRAVKNALSHMYIEHVSQNQEITSIRIWDKLPNYRECHTKLNFSVSKLKEFALYVADLHLERLNEGSREE